MKLLKDILYGARITQVIGSTHIAVESVVSDSRQVKPFGCFVAISGTTVDGHEHIPSAIRSGAAAVVCETLPNPDDISDQVVYIQVESARSALGHLAANYHNNPSERLKIVAVTGTNGKTTVATLLHRLARLFDRKAGLVSTVENRIVDRVVPATHTTPDPVGLQQLFADMLDAGCTHCFIEASSHALDQHRLAGTTLTGAVFTNITHDHLDYHGDFNAYIGAKKSLFDNLPAGAFALTNSDARHADTMVQNTKAKAVTYGTQQVADHKTRIVENGLGGLQLHIDGQDLYSRLIGDFNASNLTAAYAVARELGWNSMDTLTHLSLLDAPEGRMQQVRAGKGDVHAIVDYAHTPDALAKVLETLQAIRTAGPALATGGEARILCVVGCGGDRDRTKRPIMAQTAANLADLVILTSDNPRSEDPSAIIAEMTAGLDPIQKRKVTSNVDRSEAIRSACIQARPGDVILVAGKGHEKYQDVAGERLPFDDVAVLAESLSTPTR
jgi:UDP-N-acetylmuramoyl-L-alanyl-D-glutamate--2,6-diaminopimelate ligase